MQRAVPEAMVQQTTGELPLMQQPMALSVAVVLLLRDPDPMVTVGPLRMVTLVQTQPAVEHQTVYHQLHLVLQVTNSDRWFTDDDLIDISHFYAFLEGAYPHPSSKWEDIIGHRK